MTENWTRKASCWLHLRGLEQNTPLLAFSLLCEKIPRIQATERGGSVRIKWDSAHLTHSGRKSTRPFQLVLVQHQLRWLKWKDCESRSFPPLEWVTTVHPENVFPFREGCDPHTQGPLVPSSVQKMEKEEESKQQEESYSLPIVSRILHQLHLDSVPDSALYFVSRIPLVSREKMSLLQHQTSVTGMRSHLTKSSGQGTSPGS